MSAITPIERLIYNRIRYYPHLKEIITGTYQLAFSIFPVRSLKSDYTIVVREGFFYGFHDKCPWSPDNNMLLAHKFQDPLRMPESDEEVEIGYFIGEEYGEFKSIGKTRAWNWQMGSMLQWMGEFPYIVFNVFDGKNHMTRIVDPVGGPVNLLPRPVSAISPDGSYALSHSFIRIRKCDPAYGYANGEEPEENIPIPREDGLFLIQNGTGEISRLFSIEEIANLQPSPSMNDSYHYFTHCLFSPSGRRFVFFHRWLTNKGLTWTRMISSDLEGSDLFIFPTSGVVTHIAWKDDLFVLAYGSTEKNGDHYYLFEDRTGKFSIFGKNELTSDGHHQFSPDRGKLITDTYPNRSRIQYLILYDIERDKKIDLVKIHSPFRYRKELRCDLHPRWDRNGTMICFDSSHTGVRALCTIKL